MAERSMLWTTSGTGHGVASGYASDRWQALIRKLFLSDQAATACVLNQVDNELAVSGTASPLSVNTGAAVDYGFLYENDTAKSLTVATPTTGLTGGHVILEANWAAQTVTALAVRNTDGNSATPALTQVVNTTWQVRLATFTIATNGTITLTDVRKRAKFSNHVYANGFDISAVDNATIGLTAGALQVRDGSIDDVKAGDRVLQLYRRAGGHIADWTTPGTTTYTPNHTRMQVGIQSLGAGTTVIAFPVEFGGKPLVIAQNVVNNGAVVVPINSSIFSGSVDVYASIATTVVWFAIGPE